MKLFLFFVLTTLTIVNNVNGDGIFTRAIDRQIARMEKMIEILKNREDTLFGVAKEAAKNEIAKMQERLTKLRHSKDNGSDGSFVLRRKRHLNESHNKKKAEIESELKKWSSWQSLWKAKMNKANGRQRISIERHYSLAETKVNELNARLNEETSP